MTRLSLLLITLALLLVGCGGSEPPEAAATDAGPAKAEPVSMRVAAITAVGTPWNDMWVRFEERMDEAALPQVDLQMYVTGQLGSEESTLSNMRRGRVQVGGYSLQGAASVVPELSIILAPFLFDSRDEVDYVMDEYLADVFTDLFAAKGLHFVQWAEVGWTNIYSREPVLAPDDVSGLAFRTSPAEGARLFGEAMGVDLISIPFPEVVPSLQTGLIRAGQSGVGMYALTGIAQEAPHFTRTRHAFDTGVVIANKAWFDALAPEVQHAFRDAIDPIDFSRQDVRDVLEQIENETFPEIGVVVHELAPAERDAWREATAGSHERLIEQAGGRSQEVYDAILAGKAAFAAQQPGEG
ncbi:MAG: TRAP transporter substrate-binding protein [Pseudomonadota bacterium]